ncbi:MAG: hypothetical protein CMP81_02875 [Fulvimarina sp.]|nr:hypothetical protein [Fulvimarina sp.]
MGDEAEAGAAEDVPERHDGHLEQPLQPGLHRGSCAPCKRTRERLAAGSLVEQRRRGFPRERNGQDRRSHEDARQADGRFRLKFADRPDCTARSLAIGTGRVPLIPPGVATGPDCFHASRYLEVRPRVAGRRVCVIGGGQSGAEVVLNLLQQEGASAPASIVWISRRDGFWTLQEGGLVDQFFTPGYLSAYREMPLEVQARALASQKFASDGLTPATADEIYRHLYRRRHLEGRSDVTLIPGGTSSMSTRPAAATASSRAMPRAAARCSRPTSSCSPPATGRRRRPASTGCPAAWRSRPTGRWRSGRTTASSGTARTTRRSTASTRAGAPTASSTRSSPWPPGAAPSSSTTFASGRSSASPRPSRWSPGVRLPTARRRRPAVRRG